MIQKIYKRLPVEIKRLAVYLINPKFVVGVAACVFQDKKILLLRQTYEKGWTLPGGMVKSGEDIKATVAREFKEELGVKVELEKILLIKNVPSNRKINILVQCSLGKNQTIKVDQWEIKEAKLFSLDSLPSNIHPAHQPFIDFILKQNKK